MAKNITEQEGGGAVMSVGSSSIAPISGPQADPTTGAVMSAQNSLRRKYLKRRNPVLEDNDVALKQKKKVCWNGHVAVVRTKKENGNSQLSEAIQYHMENDISLVENVYRPGSEMFFEVIREAKRLYAEGIYTPKSQDEIELLESDIGEYAEYNGVMVPLDFPMDEELSEEFDISEGRRTISKIDRSDLRRNLARAVSDLAISAGPAETTPRAQFKKETRNIRRLDDIRIKHRNQNPFVEVAKALRRHVKKLRLRLAEEKKFPPVPKDKETGLPKKYVAGLSTATAKARAAHWKEKSKLSDSDPRAYEPAPGDATAETKPSKHTLAVRNMMNSEACWAGYAAKGMKKKGDKMVPNCVPVSEDADNSIAAKARKSGISASTLRAVYRRGVAAWNSGHRPGTTPQQWGHARVNSYINKGKTYHTADKDLREANRFEEPLTGWHIVHKGTGQHVKSFETKDQAQKHLMTKMFADHQDYKVVHTANIKEEDKTGGKGIGKPFRSNGGGAVYVRSGDGVKKVNFSQSGMEKKFNDPERVKSFVARHHCMTNKDKTSASYWACRWPRYFSNSGKKWW